MPRRWKPYRRSSRAASLQSAVWLIGLGVLWLTHAWWPGIIIVVGLSLVAGALARGQEPAPEAPPVEPPIFEPPPLPAVEPTPAVRAPARPRSWPDLCPYCGAPPRSLPQRDVNPDLCPYCGSDLRVVTQ